MRMLAVAALAMTAGCLRPSVTQCANGAICPEGQACTEQASLCGPEARVEACTGKAEFDACETAGTCLAGVCSDCSVDLAGCRFDAWTPMTSPTTESLNAVWLETKADALAGGDRGTLLRYDGRAWTASSAFMSVVGNASVTAIWRTGDVAFVTTASGALVRGDLTTDSWQIVATDPAQQTTSVYGSSANDVVAVSLNGTIVQFDGTQGTIVAAPLGVPLQAVWMAPDGEAFAVGAQGAVVRRSGGTWSVARTPISSEPALTAVWGRSATDVWAVGLPKIGRTQPTILHFDGATWSYAPTTIANAFTLVSVRGTDSQLWMTGAAGVTHFDGTTWSSTNAGVLYAIDAIDTDVIAVGMTGRIVRLTP